VKALSLLLSLLSWLPAAQAGPINWAKHQVRDHSLRTQLIFAGISAGVYAEGLHQCRVVNLENCQEKYGAAWAGYGATVSLDLVGVLVGQKTNSLISYAGSAGMLGFGIYQWRGGLNKPKEDNAKPNLSSVTLIRH